MALYYTSFQGTIREQRDFQATRAAESLHKAMKGFGCDKAKVVHELTRINNQQRQMVAEEFKTLYGDDLCDELKGEISGDFEEVILALMETPTMYDVKQLHKAVDQGLGTKENILIEILCSRTNEELYFIKEAYEEKYEKTLEDDIIGDTSGDFKKLLVSLLQGSRDMSWEVDALKANQDAHRLLEDGEKKMGTEESTFNSILVSQSMRQLDRVFVEYEKIAGHSIEEAIKKEFGGDMEEGFLSLIQCLQSRSKYFAHQLHHAMKGFGTRDSDLIRVIVSRSEIDLQLIKNTFEADYGKSLADAVKSECGGAYRDAVIEIIDGN